MVPGRGLDPLGRNSPEIRQFLAPTAALGGILVALGLQAGRLDYAPGPFAKCEDPEGGSPFDRELSRRIEPASQDRMLTRSGPIPRRIIAKIGSIAAGMPAGACGGRSPAGSACLTSGHQNVSVPRDVLDSEPKDAAVVHVLARGARDVGHRLHDWSIGSTSPVGSKASDGHRGATSTSIRKPGAASSLRIRSHRSATASAAVRATTGVRGPDRIRRGHH